MSIDLWTEASFDAEADQRDQRFTAARVAAAPLWPFLAGAVSATDFENRMAVSAEKLDAICERLASGAEFTLLRRDVESALQRDYEIISQAKAQEMRQAFLERKQARLAAQRKQADAESSSDAKSGGNSPQDERHAGNNPEGGQHVGPKATCPICSGGSKESRRASKGPRPFVFASDLQKRADAPPGEEWHDGFEDGYSQARGGDGGSGDGLLYDRGQENGQEAGADQVPSDAAGYGPTTLARRRTAGRYCETHKVWIGEGNAANHDEACKIKEKATEGRRRTASILDELDPSEDYFDAAQALYWYGADYHGGQSSELYSIMSTMDYRPGMGENGPEEGSTAADIYQALESGELEASEVRDWYEAGYSATHEGRRRTAGGMPPWLKKKDGGGDSGGGDSKPKPDAAPAEGGAAKMDPPPPEGYEACPACQGARMNPATPGAWCATCNGTGITQVQAAPAAPAPGAQPPAAPGQPAVPVKASRTAERSLWKKRDTTPGWDEEADAAEERGNAKQPDREKNNPWKADMDAAEERGRNKQGRRRTATSGDILQQIQGMDPDGGPSQPTPADYARFEQQVKQRYGDQAWQDYKGQGQSEDAPYDPGADDGYSGGGWGDSGDDYSYSDAGNL